MLRRADTFGSESYRGAYASFVYGTEADQPIESPPLFYLGKTERQPSRSSGTVVDYYFLNDAEIWVLSLGVLAGEEYARKVLRALEAPSP